MEVSPEVRTNEYYTVLSPVIPRRGFCRGLLGFGAAALTGSLVSDPILRHGVAAGLARGFPDTSYQEERYISEAVIAKLYQKHFSGKEHLLPYEAWSRKDPYPGIGFAQNLFNLANLYYSNQRNGEGFDGYFERFVDDLSSVADAVGLDFISFVTTLQVSGENIGNLREQAADVLTSGIQTIGVPLTRHLGLEYSLLEGFRPYGLLARARRIVSSLGETFGRKVSLGPSEVVDINAIYRLRMEVTTGMMDDQPSLKAEALLLFAPENVKAFFLKHYPSVVRNYQALLRARGVSFEAIIPEDSASKPEVTVDGKRKEMENLALKYLEEFGERFDIFARNEEAQNKLGIAFPLDPWQKYNYTDSWYQLIRHYRAADENQKDEKFASSAIKEMLRADYAEDPKQFRSQFFAQQILNPKLLEYLMEQASKAGNGKELSLLQDLTSAINTYEIAVKNYTCEVLKVAEEEGGLEYNANFQILTSALLTKMLSKKAGEYNPSDRDSLYWHIYKIAAIRELSHPLLLARGDFGRDPRVDPPFDFPGTIDSLKELENLFLQKGLIKQSIDQDIESFVIAMQKIITNDFREYPLLSGNDQFEIKLFVRSRIVETYHTAINRAQMVLWNLLASQSEKIGKIPPEKMAYFFQSENP